MRPRLARVLTRLRCQPRSRTDAPRQAQRAGLYPPSTLALPLRPSRLPNARACRCRGARCARPPRLARVGTCSALAAGARPHARPRPARAPAPVRAPWS